MRAIADRIEGEFGQVEAGRARDARDPMVPTIGEEERALLGAENPGTLAIEMGQPPLAEDNRIFRRDHPRALRARPLWLVHRRCASRSEREDHPGAIGQTPAYVNPVIQWSARGSLAPRPFSLNPPGFNASHPARCVARRAVTYSAGVASSLALLGARPLHADALESVPTP